MNTIQAHEQSVLLWLCDISQVFSQHCLTWLKGLSMGDTTTEMVSYNETFCNVKETRVHYRALFFPLCCLLSSSLKKKISFFSQSKWEYLGFILLIFNLLGRSFTVLRLLLRVVEWKVSILFSCSSCLDLSQTWTLAVGFLPFTKPFLPAKFSLHTSLLKDCKYIQSLTGILCCLHILTGLEAMLSIFLSSPIHSTGNTIPIELQLLLK